MQEKTRDQRIADRIAAVADCDAIASNADMPTMTELIVGITRLINSKSGRDIMANVSQLEKLMQRART